MKYSNQSYNIRIDLDTQNCELSAAEITQVEESLSPLRELVKDFPVADLYVNIEYKLRSHEYRLKVALQLPGKGLATGDVEEHWHPALQRSLRKLVQKVSAYKEAMEGTEAISKHEKGTRHDVVAQREIDKQAVEEAVRSQNYADFRTQLYPYEESVRKRIGRWIQRYPTIEAQLGSQFDIADLVEEVFLNAFERFDDHPRDVPFGDWLEQLIDPSVKLLSEKTDEEMENVSFVRSALEAEQPREDQT